MSSTCDASSDVFSMPSRVLTRANTATEVTEPLFTPADERIAIKTQLGVVGPRKMGSGISFPNHVRTHASTRVDTYYSETDRGTTRNLPHSHSLRRHQSTKQLIHRYESMGGTVPRPPRSSAAAALAVNPGTIRRKRRSLSHSLRNFMSVFKKGRGKDRDVDDKDDHSPKVQSDSFDETSSLVQISVASGAAIVPPTTSAPRVVYSSAHSGVLHSGTLLYLSKPSSPITSPILPVWTTCAVTLHASHILITWYTIHGNPSTQVIPLATCMDVRSLPLAHLNRDERALLPAKADGEDVKIFEILFEEYPRERFAAASAQDRAQWVSAIWDAIMRVQERCQSAINATQDTTENLMVDTNLYAERPLLKITPVSASEYTGSDYTGSSALETERQSEDNSLPPTPIAKSPAVSSSRQSRTTLQDVRLEFAIETESVSTRDHTCGLSPSMKSPSPTVSVCPSRPYSAPEAANAVETHCPQTPSSYSLPFIDEPRPLPSKVSISIIAHDPVMHQIASPSPSRSKSPSIANLGNLSVVKQRLAEMERCRSSESAATVSSALTHLNRVHTTRSSRVRNAFAEIEKMQEEDEYALEDSTPKASSRALPLVPSPVRSDSSRSRSAFRRWRQHEDSTKEVISLPPLPIQVETTNAAPVSNHVGGLELAPLAELIKDSAAKHYDQTAGLGEQIIALQRDIHNLPVELMPLVIDNLRKHPSHEENGHCLDGLADIGAKLEDIQKRILPNSERLHTESVMETLKLMQAQLKVAMPKILEKLEDIQKSRNPPTEFNDTTKEPFSLNNLPPSVSSASKGEDSQSSAKGLADIYAKLEELALIRGPADSEVSCGAEYKELPRSGFQNNDTDESDKLQEVLTYLKTDETQRKFQLEQQADSVRYLNELNSWLDAFVNNGTAQIQSVAEGVEQLCKQLGCGGTPGQEADGVLGEIRQQLSVWKDHQENSDQLQMSVESLIQAVQGHLTNGAEERSTLVTESVMELISQQRQDQEQMLRALSSELTNEIRGERLRFVEAMKEATAINVQAHVEHFKAELGREVMVMTQDVGRLHKEKQAMEQQIADLFAFYSKQKQEGENAPRRATGRSVDFQNMRNVPSSQSTRRRPLPNPGY
ncbi:hypothetical protein BJ138DRAFT_238157 [Hygrophoropsis aurantiaca]|uniref:Uncharacterized protein n=1 Tax=Hygrophoropsis aurantiaca TaxID=72124 RepID=A0ACB8A8D3_9AGAM|nr:hypothetical protein BJ138DRAFT_238157 [Hygrophoropsis aurantiaca]